MWFKDGAGIQYQLSTVDPGRAVNGAAGHDVYFGGDIRVIWIVDLKRADDAAGRDVQRAVRADRCFVGSAARRHVQCSAGYRSAAVHAAGRDVQRAAQAHRCAAVYAAGFHDQHATINDAGPGTDYLWTGTGDDAHSLSGLDFLQIDVSNLRWSCSFC